jgi:hypothetical protein
MSDFVILKVVDSMGTLQAGLAWVRHPIGKPTLYYRWFCLLLSGALVAMLLVRGLHFE